MYSNLFKTPNYTCTHTYMYMYMYMLHVHLVCAEFHFGVGHLPPFARGTGNCLPICIP